MDHKSNILRKTALALATILLYQAFYATPMMALTSGPSQPEFQSFQPAGVSDMVDMFSGNFSYNIPLLDVGGYPINISYSSDNRMDDEASWVGLGWTLNPGSISRQMRGLPDDYKGDIIEKEFNQKKDLTVSVSGGAGLEIFGKGINKLLGDTNNRSDTISAKPKLSLIYNSYRGFELDLGLGISDAFKTAKALSPESYSLGLGYSPSQGLSLNPGLGFGTLSKKNITSSLNLGLGYNSRQGLTGLTYQGALGYVQKENKVGQRVSNSIGSGGNFLPGGFSYIPTSQLPIKNESGALRFTVGGEAFGLNGNVELEANFAIQSLESPRDEQKSFGYLYLDKGAEDENAVLDYNSEIGGQIQEETPNLPLAYGTPDIYSIQGQGISGSFQAMRGDVGLFRPALERNTSVGGSFGGELGAGAFFKAGVDIQATIGSTSKGAWENAGNNLKPYLKFDSNNETKEAVYFKSSADNVINISDRYAKTGNTDPIRANVDNQNFGMNVKVENQFLKETGTVGSELDFQSNYGDNQRNIRNQLISYSTFEEVKTKFDNYTNRYKTYPFNALSLTGCAEDYEDVEGYEANAKDHHIAEIDVTQPDGSRYVFGQPVYNVSQKEVTFSVDSKNYFGDNSINNVESPEYGLVKYIPGESNSVDNKKGDDHSFDSKVMAPYAHTYLLTELLSPDYVDLTGDGVTDDDLGNAIKFNYSKVGNNYKWRIPYSDYNANDNSTNDALPTAKHHPGLISTDRDDKASYTYGEREVWYQHSIESRTMAAIFYTSERDDALGVLGENGGKNTATRLRKLDKIELYSKSELNNKAEKAVPIKTVHFEYNYDLCQGVPNSMQGGKLTLEKIYFTYGKNGRGKLNAYIFDYKNNVDAYNLSYYDRWGFYKKHPKTGEGIDKYQPHHDYPFVLQNEDAPLTQDWAGLWNLNKIELPSGGIINVDYEADDYAYVQDKRAGQMMEILGFAESSGSAITDQLYNGLNDYDYMAVKLPVAVTSAEEAKKRYLEDVSKLYFSVLMRLRKGQPSTTERVSGYMEYNKDGIVLRDDTTLLIPLKPLKDRVGTEIPAITYAGLQTMKFQRPELIYPGYRTLDKTTVGAIIEVAEGMVGAIGALLETIVGFEKKSMLRERAKFIETDNRASWVRLANPDFKKLGGGSRVSEITISDQWNQGVETPSVYGQTYDYTKTININGNEQVISSGVASYEPAMGGEENLHKNPLAYRPNKWLADKSLFYSESPIGESLYPGASVGYSKVTVSDIANTNGIIDRTKSGKTIHEFYTAKDFPTLVQTTSVDVKNIKGKLVNAILSNANNSTRGLSQGYVIELNDMHGKPLRQTVLDKNDVPLTSTEYRYQESIVDNKRVLTNNVTTLDNNGMKSSGELGVDVCVWQEMWQEKNVMTTPQVSLNADGFPAGIIPLVIPTVYPRAQYERKRMQVAVTTKQVNRKGILDKVIVTENGSTIETQNIAYDHQTGNVLLTRTQNEFDDDMYAFNYPAHWVYDNMGQGYQNSNAIFNDVDLDEDQFLPRNLEGKLNPGDHVLLSSTVSIAGIKPIDNFEAYVATNQYLDNRYVFLAPDGSGFLNATANINIKVLRSAKKNMAATSIGQVTSRQSPLEGSSLVFNDSREVINASAMTYADIWGLDCTPEEIEEIRFNEISLCDIDDLFNGVTPTARLEDFRITLDLGTESLVVERNKITSLQELVDNFNLNKIDLGLQLSGCKLVSQNSDLEGAVLGFQFDDGLSGIYAAESVMINSPQNVNQESYFNPYTSGYANNFRPESSFVFYDDRTASDFENNGFGMRIRDQGYASGFAPYWTYVNNDNGDGQWKAVDIDTIPSWTFTNKVTEYDIKGNEIENVNAIGIYSAAQFGYKDALATAVANNAQKKEIFFESFEDQSFNNDCEEETASAGLELEIAEGVNIIDHAAHTGFHSLQFTNAVEYEVLLAPYCDQEYEQTLRPCGIITDNANYQDIVCQYDHRENVLEVCLTQAPIDLNSLIQLDVNGVSQLSTVTACNDGSTGLQLNLQPGLHNIEISDNPTCVDIITVDIRADVSANSTVAKTNDSKSNAKVSDITVRTNDFYRYFDNEVDYAFVNNCSVCLPQFLPEAGSYYNLSTWIATDSSITYGIKPSGFIEILDQDHNVITTIEPKGAVIEGWQRVDGKIEIPGDVQLMKIRINKENEDLYIDDFRFHPFRSNMNAYVYDPFSLRLMATLDENNYASFYEYDDEGILIRVKRETEKGIATVQEGRTVLKPNNLDD